MATFEDTDPNSPDNIKAMCYKQAKNLMDNNKGRGFIGYDDFFPEYYADKHYYYFIRTNRVGAGIDHGQAIARGKYRIDKEIKKMLKYDGWVIIKNKYFGNKPVQILGMKPLGDYLLDDFKLKHVYDIYIE